VIASCGSTAIGRHPERTPAELGFEALDRARVEFDRGPTTRD
jgi:hypothetical protein